MGTPCFMITATNVQLILTGFYNGGPWENVFVISNINKQYIYLKNVALSNYILLGKLSCVWNYPVFSQIFQQELGFNHVHSWKFEY